MLTHDMYRAACDANLDMYNAGEITRQELQNALWFLAICRHGRNRMEIRELIAAL